MLFGSIIWLQFFDFISAVLLIIVGDSVQMFSSLLCKVMKLDIVSVSLLTPGSWNIVFVYKRLQLPRLHWFKLLTVNSYLLCMLNWSTCSQKWLVWIQVWGAWICLWNILISGICTQLHTPWQSSMTVSFCYFLFPSLIAEGAGYVMA